jgi:hypothetical protein
MLYETPVDIKPQTKAGKENRSFLGLDADVTERPDWSELMVALNKTMKDRHVQQFFRLAADA